MRSFQHWFSNLNQHYQEYNDHSLQDYIRRLYGTSRLHFLVTSKIFMCCLHLFSFLEALCILHFVQKICWILPLHYNIMMLTLHSISSFTSPPKMLLLHWNINFLIWHHNQLDYVNNSHKHIIFCFDSSVALMYALNPGNQSANTSFLQTFLLLHS